MHDTGNWLVPHFGGEFYSHKPPFYFFFLNLNRFLFGSYSVTAMVLSSLIPGILIALVTFCWGSIKFNKRDYSREFKKNFSHCLKWRKY